MFLIIVRQTGYAAISALFLQQSKHLLQLTLHVTFCSLNANVTDVNNIQCETRVLRSRFAFYRTIKQQKNLYKTLSDASYIGEEGFLIRSSNYSNTVFLDKKPCIKRALFVYSSQTKQIEKNLYTLQVVHVGCIIKFSLDLYDLGGKKKIDEKKNFNNHLLALTFIVCTKKKRNVLSVQYMKWIFTCVIFICILFECILNLYDPEHNRKIV